MFLLARMLANGSFRSMEWSGVLERVDSLPGGIRVYIFPDPHTRDPRVYSVLEEGGEKGLWFGDRKITSQRDFHLPLNFDYGAAVVQCKGEAFMIGSPWCAPFENAPVKKRKRQPLPCVTEEEFEEIIRADRILLSAQKEAILASDRQDFPPHQHPSALS